MIKWPFLVFLVSALTSGVACTGESPSGESPTAPGNTTRLRFQFCPGAVPAWGAFRNEGSAWTRFNGLAAGHVGFDATDRFAYALVFERGADVTTDVVYTAASEFADVQPRVCAPATTKSVTGSVVGLSPGLLGTVSMGMREVTTISSFTLTGVPDGTLDLVATRRTFTPGGVRIGDRVIIRRALNPADGEALPTIDFNSAEAHDVATAALTLDGLQGGESAFITHSLLSANGTAAVLATRRTITSSEPLYSMPPALLVPGDYHAVDAQASDMFGSVRGVIRYYHAPSSQSLAFGPALAQPSVTTIASSPNVRLRLTLASQAEYSREVQMQAREGTRLVTVSALPSHFGGMPPAWTVEVPDFTGVAGWKPSWGLQSATSTTVFVFAYGPAPERVAGVPADGSTLRFARVFISIVSAGASRID